MEYAYHFPAVRGIQARREYYIGMVPLKMISRLFSSDEEYLQPEYRAQRKLNTSRVPVISQYIVENRDNYVFSALAASIDGEYRFNQASETASLGVLEVSMDARFLINDGQHRKAAILEALQEDPTLGEETIPVVFFEDAGLARSQQLFTDLNKHAVKTSNSISELYDSRDPLAVITRAVIFNIPFFNEYTDKETDNLGKYSSNLFTLNTFYKANKRALRNNPIDEKARDFLQKYWEQVAEHMSPWHALVANEISKKDLRENYIATQGVVIQALGRLAATFYQSTDTNIKTLEHISKINWRRSALQWQGRAIKNGRIITNNEAIILTCNAIKNELHLPFTDDEKARENHLVKQGGMNNGR